MRTIIFIIGMMFLEILHTHWGMSKPFVSTELSIYLAFVLSGCVVLDILK